MLASCDAKVLNLLQVFKGIKNGVQDVAVKVLINSDEIQVQLFQEVSHGPAAFV